MSKQTNSLRCDFTLTVGENFSTEPGGLFEEPPAMIPAVADSVGPVDPALAQQKNGNVLIVLFHLSSEYD